MDQTELIKQISATMGKMKVLALTKILEEANFNLPDLIAVTFNNDKDIAFRASWLLENLFLKQPDKYVDHIGLILAVVPKVTHPGPQRHYTKILMHLTASSAPAAIKYEVAQFDMETIIEQLFDWMIGPKVKVAVKVFAAEALFNLSGRYPWLNEELAQQLHFLMRDGSAAMQVAGRRILKQIAKSDA